MSLGGVKFRCYGISIKLVQMVTLLVYVWKVPSSNQGQLLWLLVVFSAPPG